MKQKRDTSIYAAGGGGDELISGGMGEELIMSCILMRVYDEKQFIFVPIAYVWLRFCLARCSAAGRSVYDKRCCVLLQAHS